MNRQIYIRPTLLDGEPRVVYDRRGRPIRWAKEGVLRTLDTHLSRAIKAGDLEVVDSKKSAAPVKGGN